MKRSVKRVLYAVAGIVLVFGAAMVALHFAGDRKRARIVKVDVKAIALPADAAAQAQGRYLFESRGCAECHGGDGRGRVVVDSPNGLYVRAPNISGGAATVARYSVEDWVRVLRHGVKPDGTPVVVMPSQDYNRLSDADTGALIAYARSLPPGPGDAAEIRFPFLVKALYAVGLVPDAAEVIDHALPPTQPVPVSASVEHGRYVANMCIGCHGPGLSGGRIPGGPPEWPAASNLTPGTGSVLPRYDTGEKFRAMLRTGKRPDGSAVSTVMPFASLKALNDTDVDALYAFLKTVPARPAGDR